MKTAKEIAKKILNQYVRDHKEIFDDIIDSAIQCVIEENIDCYDILLEASVVKFDYYDLIEDIGEAASEVIDDYAEELM